MQGHAGAFDTDHLRTKLVLLLDGAWEQLPLQKILNRLQAKQSPEGRKIDVEVIL